MERPPLEPEIRQFIGTLAACDWLDTTLAHIPMGKRADYYFRIPNIIVEQKGIHVDRRSYLANAMQRAYVLVRKNGMDDQQFWDFAARSGGPFSDNMLALMNERINGWEESDKKELIQLHFKTVKFLEKPFSVANKQIANTKHILGHQDAGGLVLLVNDVGGHIPPMWLGAEVSNLLNQKFGGKPRFGDVDGVILLQRLRNFSNLPGMSLYYRRIPPNPSVDKFAADFLTSWGNSRGGFIPFRSDGVRIG